MAKKKAVKKKAVKKAPRLTNLSINVFTPEAPPYVNKVKIKGSRGSVVTLTKTPGGLICVKGEAFYEDFTLDQAAAITYPKGKVPPNLPQTPPAGCKFVPGTDQGGNQPGNYFVFTGDDLVPSKCKGSPHSFKGTLVIFTMFDGQWLMEHGEFDYLGQCSEFTECDLGGQYRQPADVLPNRSDSATKKKTAKKKVVKKTTKKK